MSSAKPVKDDRINLRLKHSAKLILERAAGFNGQTVSKFVLRSALAQAEKTIQERETMALNAKEARVFFDALDAPIRFNKKLLEALEEHDRRVSNT